MERYREMKKANLLGLMLAYSLLAAIIVIGAVGGITWITDPGVF